MLTTKNGPALVSVWLLLFVTALLGQACKPSGSAQLLRGERLVKEGRYTDAIETLQSAIPNLRSNALGQAWNHLGLAYHRSGKVEEAVRAYQQAFTFDRNLAPPRFNLGCLLLEQNDLPGALNELTTFTVLQPNSGDGWTQLGHALLRARRPDEAERAFQNAIRSKGQTPELLTGIGVAHAQRKKGREAVQHFSLALQKQPSYGPALFNLAAAQQDFFRNPTSALALFKDYVATQPANAPHISEVRLAMARLEPQVQPPTAPVFTNQVPQVALARPTNSIAPPVRTNLPFVVAAETNRAVVARTEPPPVIERSAPPVRPPDAAMVSKAQPKVPAPVETPKDPEPAPPVQVVQLPAEETPPAPRDVPVTLNTGGAEAPAVVVAQTNRTVAADTRPEPPPLITKPLARPQEEKKGWTDKVNPVNWFKRDKEEKAEPERRPPGKDIQIAANQKPAERLINFPEPSAPKPRPRYKYLNPPKPASGNRAAATAKLLQAYDAHKDRRWEDAMRGYQEAIELDPSYYEAHLNLAVAAYQTRRFELALAEAEKAIACNPEGAGAREQLAASLQNSGFHTDAAEQLSMVVKTDPKNARAHLHLANILAQELENPAAARPHYQKVLELEPQHPRAPEIRYWLASRQ